MMETIIKGFMLGLSTGPACMVSCFPVLLPIVIGDFRPGGNTVFSWGILLSFLSGRAMAYAAFGAVVGFVGNSITGIGHTLAIGASMLLAVLLVAYGLGAHIPSVRTCHLVTRWTSNRHFPFILGFLTGLNVCPPFLLAMTVCLTDGSDVLRGILFFLAFFVASSLYMLPAGAARLFVRVGPSAAATGRLAAVAVGLFFIASALMELFRTH